jgi:hypothetical protein
MSPLGLKPPPSFDFSALRKKKLLARVILASVPFGLFGGDLILLALQQHVAGGEASKIRSPKQLESKVHANLAPAGLRLVQKHKQ